MTNKYWLLRGCSSVGKFNDSGEKIGGVKLHTVDMEIGVEHTFAEHMNTCDEVSKIDARDAVETKVNGKFTADEVKNETLEMALAGIINKVTTGGTFTDTAFPSGLAVGGLVPIPDGWVNLDTLTITDNNGTPATLVAGTNYKADLRSGEIEILDLAAFTQPLKASGAEHDNFSSIGIAQVTKQERWVTFDGVNLNDSNLPVILSLHKVSIDPTTVQVKQDGNDYSSFEFEFTALAVRAAPKTAEFGQFGRIAIAAE